VRTFLARRSRLLQAKREGEGTGMKHYRVNKLTTPGGEIVKKKDILANNDQQALDRAEKDDDCPVCDVWHAGEKVGSIT
jgi:hypothetical protein